MMFTTQIWVVLVMVEAILSTANQTHYPDLSSKRHQYGISTQAGNLSSTLNDTRF